jgi:iron complex transport system permease protein
MKKRLNLIWRNRSQSWLPGASLAVLLITLLATLTKGTAPIPTVDVITVLLAKLGLTDAAILATPTGIILWEIRWPRVALAVLAGSALAISGACYQTLFRNPLADPFILGVSSGAALGAAIAITFWQGAYLTLSAFGGSAVAVAVVYFLGRQDEGADSQQLLLAGVAFGSMLSALLSCIMAVFSQQIHLIVFWLMGSLASPVQSLPAVAAAVCFGMAAILFFARDLDLVALGEETAHHLGVNLPLVRLVILGATTLITGAVVSVTGIIGFIGLVVPHMVRNIAGPEHVRLLPLSAVWGAILLLWADSLTRMFTSLVSIPVGVVTALFGGPFFLYILYTARTGR